MTAIVDQAEPWEHYLVDELPDEYHDTIDTYTAEEALLDVLSAYAGWKPPGDWLNYADCATVDPDLFHVDERAGAQVKRAKAICAGCPVKEECLLDAIDRDDPWGIWGGMTYPERMVEMIRRDIEPSSQMASAGTAARDTRKLHFRGRGQMRVELIA